MKEGTNYSELSIAIDGREVTNQGTGIGRYTNNLIMNLLNLDKTTRYFVLTNAENIQLGEYPNLIVLPSKKMKSREWETNFIPEVMKQYNVDLFHNTRSGNTYFQPLDFPFVTTVHDIIPWKFRNQFSEKIVNRWKDLFPHYVNCAKHIISVSNKTAEDLVEWTGVESTKISVIYQGINPMFKRIPEETAKLLMKANYGIDQPYIFTMGRNQQYKNVETLIKAYGLLPEGLKERLNLVITGNRAEEYQSIINQLSLQEFVKPLGYIAEELLPALYSGSELFVFPSLYEGFGFPPLEAMSYGVPVISSDMDTMKEVLGNSAIYFNPCDPCDIADKIQLMMNNPSLCMEMSEKGIEHVKKYSWEETARQTLQVYHSILAL
ncbi:glycosyltransferase family 1 protein [Bacillus sp. V5-8f]|uniref:glycosyltransferase family 4 protein n=1 Tax=Bacillus sp. V5-8f TaxID=2053044 RepID=UPI0015E1427E|nr:glycosyltransferase family 1 protein [Bacillus sp. V5-8f]